MCHGVALLLSFLGVCVVSGVHGVALCWATCGVVLLQLDSYFNGYVLCPFLLHGQDRQVYVHDGVSMLI